jgi:D-glycero-D-manno-heptose 1,7-bisphosphate phosphatase
MREEALNEPQSQDRESGEEGSRSEGTTPERGAAPNASHVCAVLFDRDETIVVDVPFNGDPDRVRPAPNAKELLDRLRAAGLPLAVVSNQSGVRRGFITTEQVDAVNRRIDELLGPFAGFFVCPHSPDDACECRKPKPQLILDAAHALGVDPACCIVVGDRESDVEAARRAGAIPLKIGGPDELAKAVDKILSWEGG